MTCDQTIALAFVYSTKSTEAFEDVMTDWISGNCGLGDIEIHYLRSGGDKTPMLLLHGLMLSGACWIPLARSFAADFDVILPDARGHGRSCAPKSGYSYENLALDLAGLITELQLDKPVILGHSMGGMTASLFAARYPEQLSALILADPTFLSPERQREVQKMDVGKQHERVISGSKQDLLNAMRARQKQRSEELMKLFVDARFQTSLSAFEILALPAADFRQLVKAFSVPSLLVTGDLGAVISVELARELTALNPRLESIQVSEAGHGLPFDQPERFCELVQEFLSLHMV